MPITNPHEICSWPKKEQCLYDFRPGVRCAPIQEEYRLECNLPQKPDFAVDHKEPIVVEWPPRQEMGQGDCEEDTGIREDMLAKIPDQIIPQVVTVAGTPTIAPPPGQSIPARINPINHPVCPDGQLHMELTPQQPVKTEIRIPDMGYAVRQPMRPWKQCIENTLINDAVRRPLARWCHKRPLPPLVIPTSELQRLQDKCTETERKKRERAERIAWRECQRLKSRERMGKWNYTVESLLERKKAKEEEKERSEREGLLQLMKDIKANKDAYSEEQLARAKKLMLYRKGLIKDFHSAMAFSKMSQEIERAFKKSGCEEQLKEDSTLPICDQKCMKKMLYEIRRPNLADFAPKPEKRVSEKLLKTLQSIESRQKEQECEQKNEVCGIKQMLLDNLPELPKAYLKHIAEPKCDEDETETTKFLERRDKLYEEIDDKLAVDAYIESHEKEVERQACEYQKYRLHKELIRKQTEERLIKEKVKKNIEKSDRAAAVLVEMRNKEKKANSNNYDTLKEQWEAEYEEKDDEKKAHHQRIMERVIKDFEERKGVERCKWQMRDVSRLWARERLVAVENYEQDCERKNIRRQQAEENQLYNLSLASERKCQEAREKYMNDVWGEKMKSEYFEEMQEMKDYANGCIRDWQGKGRSPLPMHMAMKKWEWDSQMDPRMFREYEKKKNAGKECGSGDMSGFATLVSTGNQPFKCESSQEKMAKEETTQSTSRRLGFC